MSIEAVEVPQHRLAEVDVAFVDEGSRRRKNPYMQGSEYLFKVHHHHFKGIRELSQDDDDGAVGSRGLESPQVAGTWRIPRG